MNKESYSIITADYVIYKIKNKNISDFFLTHIKAKCKENKEFAKEMSKIRFVLGGRKWGKQRILKIKIEQFRNVTA